MLMMIMVMMMMITGIPVGKVKCRHKQGKTAHQLGSCLGGGSAGDECGEDDDYLHIQVKFETVIVKIVKRDDDGDHE